MAGFVFLPEGGFCFFAPPSATLLLDVIVLNFWHQEIGRLDANGYILLEAVFAEAVKAPGVDRCGRAVSREQ
jgi:hypothetical protein